MRGLSGRAAVAMVSVVLVASGCGSSSRDGLFFEPSSGGGGNGANGAFGGGGSGGGFGASGGSGGTLSTGGVGGGTGGAATGGNGGNGGADGCNGSGKWAMYVVTPVSWPGTLVLAAGSGNLQVWLLSERTHIGNTIEDNTMLCGIQVPSFQTQTTSPLFGGERYGVRFLAEAFENGMPSFTTMGTLSDNLPGASFTTSPTAILFGATMSNPVSDPWPALAELSKADHDGDNVPGVTTQTERGTGWSNPPIALTGRRAIELFIASRTVVVLSGTVVSCSEIAGNVEVQTINGDPALDTHRVGCRAEDRMLCMQSETDFVDANGPIFQPATNATFVGERVPPATTCANVRAMYPRP